MIKYTSIREIRTAARTAREHHLSVGLVPATGHLHEGHRSLIERARQENDRVIVCIIVNPAQSRPDADLESFPADQARDMTLCQMAGVDWVYAPADQEMVAAASLTTVDVALPGDLHCGAGQPGRLSGVCLVVAKLFNICQPDRAYFDEIDSRQLAIIRQLAADMNFPVAVIGCPTGQVTFQL